MVSCGLKYLQPFYVICNILVITPPHKFGDAPKNLPLIYHIYTITFLVLFTVLLICSHNGRSQELYPELQETLKVVDIAANVYGYFVEIFVTCTLIYWKRPVFLKLLSNLDKISKEVNAQHFCRKRFLCQMIFVIIVVTIITIFDFVVWARTMGFNVLRHYLIRSYTYIVINMITFLMSQLVIAIRHILISLRMMLEKSANNSDKFDVLMFNQLKPCVADVRKIGRYYSAIHHMVEDFNDTFGMIILFGVLLVVIVTLHILDFMIIFVVDNRKIGEKFRLGSDIFVLGAVWVLLIMSQITFLSASCTQVLDEVKRLIGTCFKLINSLPVKSSKDSGRYCRDELLLLIRQIELQCPIFLAAGYLPINCSMIGFIISTVATYLIVTFQFIK